MSLSNCLVLNRAELIGRIDDAQDTDIVATSQSPRRVRVQWSRNMSAAFYLNMSITTCLARNKPGKSDPAASRSKPTECRVVDRIYNLVTGSIACIDKVACPITNQPQGHSPHDLIQTFVCRSQVNGIIDVEVLEDFALEGIACVSRGEQDG